MRKASTRLYCSFSDMLGFGNLLEQVARLVVAVAAGQAALQPHLAPHHWLPGSPEIATESRAPMGPRRPEPQSMAQKLSPIRACEVITRWFCAMPQLNQVASITVSPS